MPLNTEDQRTFFSKLDFYTPKLLEIFGTKSGVAGTKIRPMLNSISQQYVEGRRDAVIHCLMEFLGESGEELIKDYQRSYDDEGLTDDESH